MPSFLFGENQLQNSRVFSPVSQFIVHTPDLPFSVKYTFAVLLPR